MNKPRIFILSPDTNIPIGGIKQLYRHTDILNNNGFEAYILHSKKNFRCNWFDNNTRICRLSKTKLQKSDYLVVPEIYGGLFCRHKMIKWHNRQLKNFISTSNNTVVFNQNCYLTFNGFSTGIGDINPFWQNDSIKAVLVVSEDSRQYMNYALGNIKVFKIHNSIDREIFSYQKKKKKLICYMPRKLAEDAVQVINILKYRNALGGFELTVIDSKNERQVAEIMKESLIFLSFSYQEGCQLPPMEAMLCGCVVIGYDGRGGREYFKSEFCYPVEQGDIISFAKTVEEVILKYNRNPDCFDEQRHKASEYIENNYSSEKETEDVLRCWRTIISL
jgi:glycosyltransferase involved in cell wall biosynthesis